MRLVSSVTFLIAAPLVAACLSVVSAKAPDYVREPRRIFVVSSVGSDLDEGDGAEFREHLMRLARRCRVDVRVFEVDPLRLDDRFPDEEMRAFAADSVLQLRVTGGTVQNGRVDHATFAVRLLDVRDRKVAWNAKVSVSPPRRGFLLAEGIATGMHQDGVLSSCGLDPE